MEKFEKKLEQLDPVNQTIVILATLIPPPISLDLWAKAASLPSVKILQMAERLVRLKIMKVYEPLGVGHYYFNDPKMIPNIIRWFGPDRIEASARNLANEIESDYPEGPHRWMALAYLCQTAHIEPSDPAILLKAAEYCLNANLKEDAAEYYQLIINQASGEPKTPQTRKVYTDAVIGLCLHKGKKIPFQEQERLLKKALHYSRSANDSQCTALVLANIGQINRALGNYETATAMFEQAWNEATSTGSEVVVRRVALAFTDFLIWQGRIAEAIERYENVLGNLEELPIDEPSLLACAKLGWMYGKCGQTVRGIGLINSVMEKATELNLGHLRTYSKIVLINTLHDARRNAEAEPIVDEVFRGPHEKLDHGFLWPLCAAKAYVHANRGEYEESFAMQQKAYLNANLLGNYHHRGPINFEYMDILEDAGFTHPEMNYESEVHRVINWPDIYMQGVGYYYRAKRTLKKKGSIAKSREDLHKSLDLLTQSGAKLDLAYTQVLLGQLLIQVGEREPAEIILKEAWNVLRFVNEKIFPEELRSIVLDHSQDLFLLDPLIQISETLGTIRSKRELLKKIISLTLQLTGAERGAFFVPKKADGIEMIASRNIEPELFQTQNFSTALANIKQVMETGREVIRSNISDRTSNSVHQVYSGWQIAYPVKLQGVILGSFFLERNLSGFEVSDRIFSLLKVISTQVAVALDNVRAYEEIAELKEQLEAEALFYRSKPSSNHQRKNFVGESVKMKEVISKISDVAQSDTTVLITGETGVGKELVAKAVHQMSNRSAGPFIPVSIASLSENLIPSELFGHEKGAFTNAMTTHRGRFELANNGTLFLDEVNSLSLDIQSKLLRVLEEKVFERVGGSTVIKPDFRLIAATNQSLNDAVKKGTFRADLYYRLNVYPIVVPPLRERKEDIPLLIAFFVEQYNQKFGKDFNKINKRSIQNLEAYQWPGNVRELKHTVERAVLSCKDKQLSFRDFDVRRPGCKEEKPMLPLREMERQYILEVLSQCGWKVSGKTGAAKLLGLNPQTLYSKINRLGIKKNISMEINNTDSV